ncbi:MAG: hypothetical protein ACTSU8_00780 [Alphaproteobacteria bacterium]
MRILSQLFLIVILLTGASNMALSEEQQFLGLEINENAHPEVSFFESNLGSWDIRWEALSTEDGTIAATGNAEWHWFTSLNGYIIQDFWIGILPNNDFRPTGTNVRFFDPETNKWTVVWTNNYNPKLQHFEGEVVGDEFTMYRLDSDPLMRIRFFDLTADTFRQQQELSTDGGQTWVPSFKAYATRMKK